MEQEIVMNNNKGYTHTSLNLSEQASAKPLRDGNLSGDSVKVERLGQ